jgi:hypothetical protein
MGPPSRVLPTFAHGRTAARAERHAARRDTAVYPRLVAEYQVTYWRELPSLVVAREGGQVTKSPLAPRFQGAIDEAAMRLGDTSSDDYLSGWRRGDWTAAEGAPVEVLERVVAALEEEWPPSALADYLDSLGSRP